MKNIEKITEITEEVIPKHTKKSNGNKGFTITLIIVCIISICFNTFIAQLAKVNGDSMLPALENGQILLVSKLSKNDYKRGDIVVFKYNGRNLIKRLIGLPGERVQIIGNDIYINDEKIDDFVDVKMKTIDENKLEGDGVILKEDEYIFLGDNRNNSLDSRRIGVIKKEDIIGKVVLRFYPFGKY